MELRSYSAPVVLIGDHCLQFLRVIGSGGFGQIHKAKHTDWGMVAIKLLHFDDGSSSSLLKEADLMRQGGSTYVLRVLGVYQGVPPGRGPSSQLGLVMEFMERGSLASLQERLRGPPPWPLAFRLAHQVALGMNFLHCLSPQLLHLDLKPSNVLLDDGLGVKLTDFGLAKLVHSMSSGLRQEEAGGTVSYMPPEAFRCTYKPTPASDIYSYAILLWSIITGEEPYPHARSDLIQLRIPEGDRPDLSAVNKGRVEGLRELADLMEQCWHPSPKQRPSFHDCLPVTEKVFEAHKCGITDAVYQVQLLLEDAICRRFDGLHVSPAELPIKAAPVESVKTGPLPVQEVLGGVTPSSQAKAPTPPHPKRALSDDPSLSSANHTPPAACTSSKQTLAGFWPGQIGSNQQSLPGMFAGGINISMSGVSGVQIGNNNSMVITTASRPRRRNPTAPPTVQTPASQPRKSSR
ncbi:receptor-interacting serine/threonine-protein kinase 3 isoform X2 [Megalops cyprinoides]|uniref:receptor-interacting serine/threonine-protein kinase 3 isoform X2 n=1 Tax=Megalops cyprinoides TaxID=118141 RepID=UPI0018651DFD|nr:receptor-interacting serine/threonine-protein kinase 3 isoform X2 [Megalops cyprinoides]